MYEHISLSCSARWVISCVDLDIAVLQPVTSPCNTSRKIDHSNEENISTKLEKEEEQTRVPRKDEVENRSEGSKPKASKRKTCTNSQRSVALQP